MSSSFLKENWISKLIKNHPIPNHLNCQLKEIIYKDKTIIFVLSDSKHFINAELTQKSIDTFTSETDIPFLEMKGCYIIIDEYTTKISDNKLTLVVDKFTYFGNECAIEGTPQDISVLYEKEQFLFDNEYFTKINELINKEDDCLKKMFRKINKNNWFMENIFCENFKLDFD